MTERDLQGTILRKAAVEGVVACGRLAGGSTLVWERRVQDQAQVPVGNTFRELGENGEELSRLVLPLEWNLHRESVQGQVLPNGNFLIEINRPAPKIKNKPVRELDKENECFLEEVDAATGEVLNRMRFEDRFGGGSMVPLPDGTILAAQREHYRKEYFEKATGLVLIRRIHPPCPADLREFA